MELRLASIAKKHFHSGPSASKTKTSKIGEVHRRLSAQRANETKVLRLGRPISSWPNGLIPRSFLPLALIIRPLLTVRTHCRPNLAATTPYSFGDTDLRNPVRKGRQPEEREIFTYGRTAVHSISTSVPSGRVLTATHLEQDKRRLIQV